MGGTLTWMVAAFDARVKVAVPIYGCGYNVDPRRTRWGLPAPNHDQLVYKQVLSPEAHAPSIRCPLLFLNATNDFHGPMDAGYEILTATPATTRQAFTPRYNHHIEPEQGIDLPQWMDWHLRGGTPFPETPKLAVALDDKGVPVATVDPGATESVEHVRVYYSLGDKLPQNRFWREKRVLNEEGKYSVRLPVVDVWQDLYVFANVEFGNKVCLSSPLVHRIPGQMGKAKGTLTWSPELNGSGNFASWVFGPAYVDPLKPHHYFLPSEGIATMDDLELNPALFGDPIRFHLASHVLGDPQFEGRKGYSLAFEVAGGFRQEPLLVRLVSNDWTPSRKSYEAKVPVSSMTPDFQLVTLEPKQFASPGGELLADWSGIDKIEILGETSRASPPRVRSLRWQALSKE
ncbi:MAG: hypothetical protein U1D30_17765 [Planctomycetota bacterium]